MKQPQMKVATATIKMKKGFPYALTRWNAMSGKQNSKMNTTLKTFFVLMFFAILNFFLALKILFLAFSFFVILLFPSPQVPRDEKYKITKNENTKNKIFASYKKIKALKNNKTKNISSAFS